MNVRGCYFEDFAPGRTYTTDRRTIGEADHVNFTTSFGFFEPLFMDRNYVARETPYGKPIVPGALTFSVAEGLTILSGILHGLLVFALLQQLTQQPRSTALLLTLVAGKIAWEQLAGPLPGSESWTGGRVIVDAHLYGALSGTLLWAAERIYATMIHQEVAG